MSILPIPDGEILCLVGPSGCGKTTALHLAAGLERLRRGEIRIGNDIVAGSGIHQPPEERGVGLVFQEFALFPHLSVVGNIAFGLRNHSGRAARATVADLLDMVGLAGYGGKYPHMLSGGEQQRVALARALAPQPRVLLLDEPFSGLDVRLRESVREQTLGILRDIGTTALIVTHDAEEAMYLGDRIAVLQGGRLLQAGNTCGNLPASGIGFRRQVPGRRQLVARDRRVGKDRITGGRCCGRRIPCR